MLQTRYFQLHLLYLFLFSFGVYAQPSPFLSLEKEIKGDTYINLSFVKAGENHNTYFLEEAIDKAKVYLEKSFKPHKIHFYYRSSIECTHTGEDLWNAWKSHNLPKFEDELTLYIFPAQDSLSSIHRYSFTGINCEIGIIPFYDQEEFNLFVVKNVMHMLGLNISDNSLSQTFPKRNPIVFQVIEGNALQNRMFFTISTHKTTSHLSHIKRFRKKKKIQYATISREESLQIRKNLCSIRYLQNKLLQLDYSPSELVQNSVYTTITSDGD